MKPSQCSTCGDGGLHHGTLCGGIQYRWWQTRPVIVRTAACHACGAVALYLDDPTLDKKWVEKRPEGRVKAKPDEDF